MSVGWVGAVLCYLAIGVAAVTTDTGATIRGAWEAMETMGWFVLVPLAVASLVTGTLMALGTKWGLFRHYWVMVSLVLTVLSVVVLLLHMPTVTATAEVARTADLATLRSLGGDLFHPGVGLVILLFVQVLNIYKPQGLTKYGWRKQQARTVG